MVVVCGALCGVGLTLLVVFFVWDIFSLMSSLRHLTRSNRMNRPARAERATIAGKRWTRQVTAHSPQDFTCRNPFRCVEESGYLWREVSEKSVRVIFQEYSKNESTASFFILLVEICNQRSFFSRGRHDVVDTSSHSCSEYFLHLLRSLSLQ